jgi:predicted thioesterase
VEAYDDAELVGKGEHERFIVAVDRFLVKAQSKVPKQ